MLNLLQSRKLHTSIQRITINFYKKPWHYIKVHHSTWRYVLQFVNLSFILASQLWSFRTYWAISTIFKAIFFSTNFETPFPTKCTITNCLAPIIQAIETFDGSDNTSFYLALAGSIVQFHFEAIQGLQDECPLISKESV